MSLELARLWRRFLAGDGAGQDAAAKALFEEASRQKAAAQVIESTVLRALLALSAGAIDDAVELARRASRMAQSESLAASDVSVPPRRRRVATSRAAVAWVLARAVLPARQLQHCLGLPHPRLATAPGG